MRGPCAKKKKKKTVFVGGGERGLGYSGWKAGLRDKVSSGWHGPIGQ